MPAFRNLDEYSYRKIGSLSQPHSRESCECGLERSTAIRFDISFCERVGQESAMRSERHGKGVNHRDEGIVKDSTMMFEVSASYVE